MIIDTSKAVQGVSYPFSGSCPVDSDLMADRNVTFSGPAEVSGTYLCSEDEVSVKMEVSVAFCGFCERCGVAVEQSLNSSFRQTYLKNSVQSDLPCCRNSCVDLTDAVNECVLLAFPSKLLCSPDCKGLCPVCGGNLNANECSCDAVSLNDNPFKVLSDLNITSGGSKNGSSKKKSF